MTRLSITNDSTSTHCLKTLWLGCWLLVSLLPQLAIAATLTATADRTTLSIEETLTLTVTYDESVFRGSPDFDTLNAQFEVLSNQRSSQVKSINGSVEATTLWRLTLAPKREGKLTIPAFTFKGETSSPVAITVKPASALTTDKPLFLETEVDRESLYVQQQLLLKIRLFTSIDLREISSEELKIDNAVIKSINETQYSRQVNGKTYGVVEVTYAVFPQQSGQLAIPAITWNITQRNSHSSGFGFDPRFSSSSKRFRLRTEAKTLDVLPAPASFSGRDWLPATQVKLSQSWSRDPGQFRVGEPITRKLVLSAEGVLSTLLPPIELPATSNVKYYPDQPQISEAADASGLQSTLEHSYAVVPSVAGEITLPAVTVDWWDTNTQQQRSATLPEQTIRVLPSAETQTPDAATQELSPQYGQENVDTADSLSAASATTHAPRWIWLALAGLLISNCLTLILWQSAKRQPKPLGTTEPPPKISEKSTWKIVKTTATQRDLQNLPQAVVNWARQLTGQPQLTTLDAVAERFPHLAIALRDLQAALYAANRDDSAFDADAFIAVLTEVRMAPHQHKKTKSVNSEIPPLYPSSN